MNKKITGFIFLILASTLVSYFLFKVSLKSNKFIPVFNQVINDPSVIPFIFIWLLFYSPFFIIIYFLFKFGIKWVK